MVSKEGKEVRRRLVSLQALGCQSKGERMGRLSERYKIGGGRGKMTGLIDDMSKEKRQLRTMESLCSVVIGGQRGLHAAGEGAYEPLSHLRGVRSRLPSMSRCGMHTQAATSIPSSSFAPCPTHRGALLEPKSTPFHLPRVLWLRNLPSFSPAWHRKFQHRWLESPLTLQGGCYRPQGSTRK